MIISCYILRLKQENKGIKYDVSGEQFFQDRTIRDILV